MGRQLSRIFDRYSPDRRAQPDAIRSEAVVNIQFLSAGQQSALLLKLAYRHPGIVLALIAEGELSSHTAASKSTPR